MAFHFRNGYSLEWRTQNEIDNILTGLPVIAIGVGLSTYDKASVHYYVQSHIQMNEYRDRVLLKHGRPICTCLKILDMSGLELSALSQIKPCDFWMDFGDCYIHLEQNIPSATECNRYIDLVLMLTPKGTKSTLQKVINIGMFVSSELDM
ncbi:hypothetical protein Bca52824_018830 [Brassica carinata]|uniref:Uncharacterized protein n=1 Tax=Brassica carinata TaxID=52824 RepID=A0A8X7VPM0_BRACI|nr:hypothetical protein Bca52824_018830 [Brassica carinata]